MEIRVSTMNPSNSRVSAHLKSLPMPLRLLSPYESLPEHTYDECRRILEEKYPDWLEAS